MRNVLMALGLLGCLALMACDDDEVAPAIKPKVTISSASIDNSVRNGDDLSVTIDLAADGALLEGQVAVYVVPVPQTSAAGIKVNADEPTEEELRELLRAPTPALLAQYARPLFRQNIEELNQGDSSLTLNFGTAMESESGNFIPLLIFDDTPENSTVNDALSKTSKDENGNIINERVFVLPGTLEIVRSLLPDLTIRGFESGPEWIASIPEVTGDAVDPNLECGRPIPTYVSPHPDAETIPDYFAPPDLEAHLKVAARANNVTGDVHVAFTAQIAGSSTVYDLMVQYALDPSGSISENRPTYIFEADGPDGTSFTLPDLRDSGDTPEEMLAIVQAAREEREAPIGLVFPDEMKEALEALIDDTGITVTAHVNPLGAIEEDDKQPNTSSFVVMFLPEGDPEPEIEENATTKDLLDYDFDKNYGDKDYAKVYVEFGCLVQYRSTFCSFYARAKADLDIALFGTRVEIIEANVRFRVDVTDTTKDSTYLKRKLRVYKGTELKIDKYGQFQTVTEMKTCVNDHQTLDSSVSLKLACECSRSKKRRYEWGPASIEAKLKGSAEVGIDGGISLSKKTISGKSRKRLTATASAVKGYFTISAKLTGSISIELAGIDAGGEFRMWEVGLPMTITVVIHPDCEIDATCSISVSYKKPSGEAWVSAWYREYLVGPKKSKKWTVFEVNGETTSKTLLSKTFDLK